MSLQIVIAPSGFKESLQADTVADCIEIGIRRVLPEAKIAKAPLVDGGEGFTKGLAAATRGTLHELTVTGPVGDPVNAHFGFLGDAKQSKAGKTAVLEMAAAAGLRLVPANVRNPMVTTTFGVGELIKAALDAGAKRILVGCGDSGTNDGGAGMAQALGVRLLDSNGNELARGGGELARLSRIELSQRDPRIENVTIEVVCNWHNVLCGENGVARVFGPQKGADAATVDRMEKALDRYAEVILRDLGIDVREMPGGGASGGLGTGLHALLGATLHPRFKVIREYLDLDTLLNDADLVFTAEGALDFQTPRGKIPGEVARIAKQRNLPVIALAGNLGKDVKVTHECGIDAFESTLRYPCTLDEAICDAETLLEDCAERVMRVFMLGYRLTSRNAVNSTQAPP